MMGNALVAFGANLGAIEEMYSEVISRLHGTHGIGVMGAGRLFDTTPIGGAPDQPRFKNGAILVDVSIPPLEILAALQEIESSLGRVREAHWGPRTIDLDLLLYEELRDDGTWKSLCVSSESLNLPHPRMHYRRFVLEPANQVAADLIHPIFGFSVADLLAHLDRGPRVIAVAGDDDEQVRNFAGEIANRAGAPFLETPFNSKLASPSEYVTVIQRGEDLDLAPQLAIWLSSGAGDSSIPADLLRELKQTRFSTWLTLDASDLEAATVEGAAAVAAMRPFAAE